MRGRTRILGLATATLLAVSLSACSTYRMKTQAETAASAGEWDTAVSRYLELLEREPDNLRWRTELLRAKVEASRQHLARARELRNAGALAEAVPEYRLAIGLDPTNDLAEVELRRTLEELASARARERGEPTIDQLKEQARSWETGPPLLDPRSDEPIDLVFPQPVSVREIYEALGKAFGINVLFDREMQDQRIAVEMRGVDANEALEMMMRAAGHFYKVLDEQTILIADDNETNRRRLEDQVIQSFFLSNADPNDMMVLLRSLIGARNMATNEKQNAVVLRDTADTVRVAERIVRASDKARGEVVVDVELIQLDVSKLQRLGASLSAYSIGTQFDDEAEVLRLSDFSRIGERASWIVSVPTVLYEFLKSDTDVEFLARPRLRISDGEEASLHIGDQVPIPVTQFNTGQTVGGNIVPITSFQYKDVGINIQLKPRIHHNREITLELGVEVSNLRGTVSAGQNLQQPIISTRKIESTIRLADGETNILAGLIQSNEQDTRTGVPGLSDIPVLGRLFSHDTTSRERTDLVLTLTPHIIRTADITEDDLDPIWVGTESNITFRGGSPQLESEAEGPFEEPARSPEEIRELIRQRLRALSEQQEREEAEEPEAPPGQDLVEPLPPSGLSDEAEEEEQPEPEDEPQAGAIGGAPERPTGGAPPATRLAGRWGRPAMQPVLAAIRGESGERRPRPAPGEELEPGSAARVRLVPVGLPEAAGDTFRLLLRVDARRPLSHLPATLRFDPQYLEVVTVERGELLGADGEATLLWDDSHAGVLTLGISRLGELPGVTGSGVAATITLRALATGSTEIGFEKLRALDAQLEPIEGLDAVPLRLRIGPQPPRDDERRPLRKET